MKLKPAGVIALLLATVPIFAHHGSTGFDQKKPVHLIGKVSMVEWVNPHLVIHLDVAAADGKVATWRVNTFPPNVASRNGFSQNSFAAGTELTVDGYQALDGSNRVNGTSIVFKDGKKIVGPDCFDPGANCFRPIQ
jgi:hypothetical protein